MVVLSIIILAGCLYDWFLYPQLSATKGDGVACRCVIFRFDDVRNGYLEEVQIAMMNFFMSNNVSLSLGLVANELSTSELLAKIDEGRKLGLFEIGVHGWDHIDYTNLSEIEQRDSLVKANQKMNIFFGGHADTFIPPFNLFNENTILAMQNAHYKILSSAIYYDEPDILNSSIAKATAGGKSIFHMPEMTDFSIYYNGTWVKVPIKFLLSDVDFDLNRYGYSVIMLHPHNFATQINGTLADILDYNQLQSLSSVINVIKNKNIKIMTFSEALRSYN